VPQLICLIFIPGGRNPKFRRFYSVCSVFRNEEDRAAKTVLMET
jgi:hypothetical protein